jgi:hypothetical protein
VYSDDVFHFAFLLSHDDGLLLLSKRGKVPMDSTPSGPQANPGQGSSPDVKAPMDPTPSLPQVNTDQGRTDVKALEEALSKLVGEGTACAFERRAQMAGSDAVWADEPSLRATPRIADLKDHPFLGDTPSPRSRFSRALTRFLVVAFIGVGCTLAWQSYGETAKQKLATSAPQLGWVLSLAGLKPWPAELIAERSSGPAVQESPDLPQAVSAAQVTPDVGTPPMSAARAPEVQQQLEAMARDLATLRQSVGQLRQSVDQMVVGQERMARDLASLQAAEKDLRRRISAPKPAAAPPRNPAPKPPPQATPQTLVAPPPQALPPVQLAPDVAAAPPAPPALPPPPVQPAPEISGSPPDSPPSRPPMSVPN